MIKTALQYIAIFGTASLMLFITYIMYRDDVNVDLAKTAKLSGPVTFCSVVTRHDSRANERVFAFRIGNSPQTLGTYRPSQDYGLIAAAIHPADTITVYYRPNTHNSLNIDVYQIEKGGKILQSFSSYKRNYTIAVIFLIVVAAVMIGLGVMKIIGVTGQGKIAFTWHVARRSWINK